MSTREYEQLTGVPKTTTHRYLRKNNISSFKIGVHQGLRPGDSERRSAFAQTLFEMIDNEPDFVSRILFTDEKTFSFHHSPNKQNRRKWSRANPREVYQGRTQYRNKVSVRA